MVDDGILGRIQQGQVAARVFIIYVFDLDRGGTYSAKGERSYGLLIMARCDR